MAQDPKTNFSKVENPDWAKYRKELEREYREALKSPRLMEGTLSPEDLEALKKPDGIIEVGYGMSGAKSRALAAAMLAQQQSAQQVSPGALWGAAPAGPISGSAQESVLKDVQELTMVLMTWADTPFGSRMLDFLGKVAACMTGTLDTSVVMPTVVQRRSDVVSLRMQEVVSFDDIQSCSPTVLGEKLERILAARLAEHIVKGSLMAVSEKSDNGKRVSTVTALVNIVKP